MSCCSTLTIIFGIILESGQKFLLYFTESESEVAQSCPTLCNPMCCSLPGSSIHRIFQARVLEWVAISFSRGSSRPRDQTATFLLTNLLAPALHPLFVAHGHFLPHYIHYIIGAFNIHKDESSVCSASCPSLLQISHTLF